MANPTPKHHADIERLETRISADKKRLLKSAAELSGRTLTDFVVSAAYEAAVRMIQEYQQLHLSIKDRDVFIQALLHSPKPTPKLLKAVKAYKRGVISK
jgi:uncharacterized protein (DUF1778 family)